MIGLQFQDWQQVGRLTYVKETKGSLPAALPYRFNKRLIRIVTKSTSTPKIKVKETWWRAGYLEQMYGGKILAHKVVPLNRDKIFALPLVASYYSIKFMPVLWLPNLTVSFFIYRGDESSVINELKLN